MSNNRYFTPGPSQLFYTFEQHLKQALKEDIPSISHRSVRFTEIMQETTAAIRELLELPASYDIHFMGSANEAWDRIIQNLVSQSSHHFVNGSFSKKFYDFAISYQKESTQQRVSDGGKFEDLTIPEAAELIGITKNETSVGYNFDDTSIRHIKSNNPDKLIALDVVSATPAIQIDYSLVDTAYFSVQKCFGMPAGLGVWITNEKCLQVAEEKAKHSSLGSYRALPNLKKFADKSQTPETPNMLYIYILGRIAKDLLDIGLTKLRNDTTYKATLINQTVENHPNLSHFVTPVENRSKSTIVAQTATQATFLDVCKESGLILGKGYGPYKDQHIRIANFPTHSKESIEQLCDLLNQTES